MACTRRSSNRDSSAEVNMEDPFEDPRLVTNAFLDIMWQDENGNSALMLAASENRVLHLKGILHMAVETGKLWQVLDMQNVEGLTALQLAIKGGCETCAMLITQVAKEAHRSKARQRGFLSSSHTSVETDDINFEIENAGEVHRTAMKESDIARALSVEQKQRRLSREKMANNIRRTEYFQLIKRSRSAHSRLNHQRTISTESSGSVHTPTSPAHSDFSNFSNMPHIGTTPLTNSPTESHPRPPTMGEKLRNIFSRKSSDSTGSLHKESPLALSDMMKRLVDPPKRIETDDFVRMPQTSSDFDEPELDDSFRSSLFSSSQGFRLPPLDKRRAASEARKRNKFLVDE